MQDFVLPGTLVTQFAVLGFYLLRPVAATRVHQADTFRLALLHAVQQLDDARLSRGIVHLLPEVGHSRIGIVATHSPDTVGIRTSQEDVDLITPQGQNAFVFEKDDRLGSNVVSRLARLARIGFNGVCTVQIGIIVEKSGTELVSQHILDSTFEGLRFYQSLVEGFLQVLIVDTHGEVHIITAINGCCSFFDRSLQVGQLVDGRIVADHHTVKA